MVSWTFEPSAVLGISALMALYFLAWMRWRERLGGPPDVNHRQVLLFAAAILVLITALASPIDTLADTALFSVHTVQHLLLTLVFAPLLLVAVPGWMQRPLLRSPLVRQAAYAITRPLPAYLVFNVIFAASHVPMIFNVVQAHLPLHVAEHVLFMATAVVMWWPVLGSLPDLPRISYPAQMLYLFLQTIGGVAIGALVTLTPYPVYDQYVRAGGLWGITPLMDQQIGGLTMWVGGGFYFFCALAVVFFVWANRDAREPMQRPTASLGGRAN